MDTGYSGMAIFIGALALTGAVVSVKSTAVRILAGFM